jgi:hypothetical protein
VDPRKITTITIMLVINVAEINYFLEQLISTDIISEPLPTKQHPCANY